MLDVLTGLVLFLLSLRFTQEQVYNFPNFSCGNTGKPGEKKNKSNISKISLRGT